MTAREFLGSRFAPFRFRSFIILFSAQGVSLVGSWMQELAKSWLVLSLVGEQHFFFGGRGAAMGMLLCAAAVPNLLIGGHGGFIADQLGAKRILMWTQLLLSLLALGLGILVFTNHVTFWWLLLFAFIEGSVIAFDIPAFNLLTPQIVPREHFQQALALNSTSFHTSRVIGPSLAGVVMALGGTSSVFFINAVSFMGVLYVIYKMPFQDRLKAPIPQTRQEAMREVRKYIWGHPLFFRILLQFVAVMCLVFPLIFTTLRVFIQQEFQLTQRDFGFVFSVPGFGALIGSLTFLLASPKNPIRVLPYGILGTVISLLALSQVHTLAMAILALAAYSISMFLTLSALLVTVQLRVEDRIRGRVSALIGMAFVSLSPVASVPIGYFSDRVGPRHFLIIVALLFGVVSLVLALRGGKGEEPSPELGAGAK